MPTKKAQNMKAKDRFQLGPCEPIFTVVSRKWGGHDGRTVVLRAKPDKPTGEEGADGCEQFETDANDEYDLVD